MKTTPETDRRAPGLDPKNPAYERALRLEVAKVIERLADTLEELAPEAAAEAGLDGSLASPVFELHIDVPWDFTASHDYPAGRPNFRGTAESGDPQQRLEPIDFSEAPAASTREELTKKVSDLLKSGRGEALARFAALSTATHLTLELFGDRPEWEGLPVEIGEGGRRYALSVDFRDWLDRHLATTDKPIPFEKTTQKPPAPGLWAVSPEIRSKAVDAIVSGYVAGFGHAVPEDLPVGFGEPLVELLDSYLPDLPKPLWRFDGKEVIAAVQFGPCVLDGERERACFTIGASALVFDKQVESEGGGIGRGPTRDEIPAVVDALRELAKHYAPPGATIFGKPTPPMRRRPAPPSLLLDVRSRIDPETVKLATFAVQGTLPRSFRRARRWEDAEAERIDEILRQHGEAAFEKTAARPPLLTKNKSGPALTSREANLLTVSLGTRGGFVRADGDGEWFVRALRVGAGFVTISLSWYHSAEKLVSERREGWAKDIRSRLAEVGSQKRLAFDELTEEEKSKIERVLGHIGTLEDARLLLDAVLRRASATGARIVDFPAHELRLLLQCDGVDGRGNERIRRGFAALEHLSFKVEHKALKGAAAGRFQGRFVSWHGFFTGGSGAHSDGVFVVELAGVVPGVAALLDHSSRGKTTIGRGVAVAALESSARSPATPASIELLTGETADEKPRLRQRRKKGDRPARALSTNGPWRKTVICQTIEEERAFDFLETNLTTSLAPDVLSRGKKDRRLFATPEGLRVYDSTWCPLLPAGDWVGALGTHRRSPETGWKLAGRESFATKTGGRKPAGLIDQVGRAYPSGSAHAERRRSALATLDDFAAVAGRLGGVIVGVKGRGGIRSRPSSWDWISLEDARELTTKELVAVRWYPFLPADWQRRADELFEKRQAERVERGESDRHVFVTRNPSDYLAAAEAEGVRWRNRPGDVEDLETWPEDGRAARAPVVRPLGERLGEKIEEEGIKKGDVAKAFGVSPASLSRWLRPIGERDEKKGSGVPAALEALVERWIEGGPLPSADELEAVSSRHGKARKEPV